MHPSQPIATRRRALALLGLAAFLHCGGGSHAASKAPAAPKVPAAPSNLTAVAGDGQVALSWTRSAGATAYHIKQATISGGPYAEVATSTTPSFTRSGLADGTTYDFVVTASNAAGESPSSHEVASTPSAGPGSFGVWTSVTPAGIDLSLGYGTQTVAVDPQRPSDLYANFNSQGIYKSTDYGLTWSGPINTGTNGAQITGDGNFAIASGGAGHAPILYGGFIHNSPGFWRSLDGGVSWETYTVAPLGARQDVYPPSVDPYDPQHLILCPHENNGLFESKDGGKTWAALSTDPGMTQSGGTAFAFFIDTGSAATTAKTILWIPQGTGGTIGTWRTENGGTAWTRVDTNEHGHGCCQIYQPGGGVVYMAGVYSALGDGVLRSADYGKTWTHVGAAGAQNGVFGSADRLYAMWGWACVPCSIAPSLEVADAAAPGACTPVPTPAGMVGGGFSQAAVTFDGAHWVIVVAMWDKGLWRCVEP